MKTAIKVIIVLALVLGAWFLIQGKTVATPVEAQTTSTQTCDFSRQGNWWYTSDPSKISVNGCYGTLKVISPGMATICVQKSVALRAPVQCVTVIASQVIPL